ncbi:MAG: FtsX-like permease family protein [Desulfobacterales bacterium]
MFLTIAWRNIWRNTRRTMVILIAIIIGVWSMIFLGALMRGIEHGMIQNGIKTLTGHIQIHQVGYRNDPVVENSIENTETIESALRRLLPPGTNWSFRIRVNAIASNARHTSAVTLVGINPVMEADVSFIGNAVSDGAYLEPEDPYGILVGRALIEDFETELGHKLILMSQDTDRDIASRAFRIKGIYDAELEQTEKKFVFISLPAAREMLNMENAISEVAILLQQEDQVGPVLKRLKAQLPAADYEVLPWTEIEPLLKTYLKLYDQFIAIWYLVVFIAMAFGIVNTTLMAVFERMREFGLLKSLGMKPRQIIVQVVTESFFLLLIGAAVGNVLGIAAVQALAVNGIDLTAFAAGMETFGMTRIIYPVLLGEDVLLSNAVVFVLGLLVCLYPAVKAARFTPVEALAYT